MRLVLFDIDGTLLSSEGMGRASMQSALTDVFGSPGHPSYRYDGKTDKQIVRDTMRLEGHSDVHIDSRMEKLIGLYLDGLRTGAKSGKFNVRPLAGVVEILAALEKRDDVVLGLLTGNIEPGARIKLTAAGINPSELALASGADEFVALGGAELAAELHALSADHLLKSRPDGVGAMARTGVTATLLPGTAFFLGLPCAPARTFLETGVRVALASDFNPGSSMGSLIQ